MIQRQKQSPKTINEQVQRKLAENGIHTDESSKNMPVSAERSKNFFTSSPFAFSYSFRANERRSLLWSRENEVWPTHIFLLLLRSLIERFRRKSNQETDTISEPSCQSSSDGGQNWSSIDQQWRCRLGLCWNDDVCRQSNHHLFSSRLASQRSICNDDDDDGDGWRSTFGLTFTIKIEQFLLISLFLFFFFDRSRSGNLFWIAIPITSVHIAQERCRQISLERPTDRIRFCREFNEKSDFS